MRVIITGAAGFIGSALTARLLQTGKLRGSGDTDVPIRELILVDRVGVPLPPAPPGMILRSETGDLGSSALLQHLFAAPVDSIFHLAASLTSEAESDIARGIEVNVLGFLALLERCRAQERAPRLVFTSSVATFGGVLPETVDDGTPQVPQTSYGVHKVIAEQLLNDHSRHGVVDGRALRLPVVLLRPPGGGSVSDRIAGIIREPLRGLDTDCPLPPELAVPVVSVGCVAASLERMHDLPAPALGTNRAINLPALSVTAAQMVAAVQRIGAGRPTGRAHWREDRALESVVAGWPRRFDSARARSLGFAPDPDLDTLIRSCLPSLT